MGKDHFLLPVHQKTGYLKWEQTYWSNRKTIP